MESLAFFSRVGRASGSALPNSRTAKIAYLLPSPSFFAHFASSRFVKYISLKCFGNPSSAPRSFTPGRSLSQIFGKLVYPAILPILSGTISPCIVRPNNIGPPGRINSPVSAQRSSCCAVALMLARISDRENICRYSPDFCCT